MKNKAMLWVLADDRIGNVNQALGVAEALDIDFETIKIKYNSLIKLPNFIIGASQIGIAKESLDLLDKPLPKVIITAGRRSSNFARYLKKKSGNQIILVQIMFPGKYASKDFDLIVVPNHDNVKDGDNILKITGSPHRLNIARLESEKDKWFTKFAHLPKPYTVLLVGGATKNKPFTVKMAEDLAEKANVAAGSGSLLITTSRRTGEEQTKALLSKITVPSYLYQWSDQTENPYFGYLALADRIIVTGDSTSMATEACFCKVPVFIYAPPNYLAPKHQRLQQELCQKGYARLLDDNASVEFDKKTYPNPAEEIAQRVKTILKLKGFDF